MEYTCYTVSSRKTCVKGTLVLKENLNVKFCRPELFSYQKMSDRILERKRIVKTFKSDYNAAL